MEIASIEFKNFYPKKSDHVIVDGARGIDENMYVKELK
jgi:hypothetical protein